MAAVGDYVGDAFEGITRLEDLPQPQIIERPRNYGHRRCPGCGRSAHRLRTAQRTLHDLGDPASGRPREPHVAER